MAKFQETALSLERISDIIDNPVEIIGKELPPIPPLEGKIEFKKSTLDFRFKPINIKNINAEISAGSLLNMGESGSGKVRC